MPYVKSGGVLFVKSKNTWMIFLTILLYSCGYRFSGSGTFPESVEYIFIEVFENQTSKTGAERTVTNQVIFEFTRQRERSLANSPEEADAILKGVIRNITTNTISRVDYEVASEREVVMTIDVKLIKKGGEIIWSAKGLSDRQAYDVTQFGKTENDRNEDVAIARISERLSERVFNRLTDNF